MKNTDKKSSARKTSKVPTKIYSYGAFEPKESSQLKIIQDQIWMSSVYRNNLIKIERRRRNCYRKLLSVMDPNLKTLHQSIDDISNQISELYKAFGGMDNDGKELHPKKSRKEDEVSIKINELKAKRTEINLKIKSIKSSLHKNYFSELDKTFKELKEERLKAKALELNQTSIGPNNNFRHQIVSDLYKELIDAGNKHWARKAKIEIAASNLNKIERSKTGCCVGTYLDIENALEKSFKTSISEPKFRKFDHTGKVGLQLNNKGLSFEKALAGNDPTLKIELLPDIKLRKNSKKEKVAAVVRMKLSGKVKDAVYLDIPFIMHRRMPEDAIIKWVYLIVNRIGYRTTYEIQFTIESSTFMNKNSGKGTVAINSGWRIQDSNDVRVATTFDGTKSTYVDLPASMISSQKFSEKLLSYCEDHFNNAKKSLATWSKGVTLSESLIKSLENIHQWKSHDKLIKSGHKFINEFLPEEKELWTLWKKNFFDAKQKDISNKKLDLFNDFDYVKNWCTSNGITDSNKQISFYLSLWIKKDNHLVNWARGMQIRIKNARREKYRILAKQLSCKYEKVIVEKWDKNKTAQTPSAENDNRTAQEENANAVRQFVGVSVLSQSLKEKFGHNLQEESPNNISKEHFKCGQKLIFNKTENKIYCAHCDLYIDRDLNAAINLYNRFCERSGDDKNTVPARKTSKPTKSLKKAVDNFTNPT